MCSNSRKGGFVHFDPPYHPSLKLQHLQVVLGLERQERLRDVFVELDRRGAHVMLSNWDLLVIYELCKDYQNTTHIVFTGRMINSKGTGRGKVNELIIINRRERA